MKEKNVLEDYELLSENELLRINKIVENQVCKNIIQMLRNYNPNRDYSKENKLAKKLLGKEGFERLDKKEHTITISDYPKIADEMEKFTNTLKKEQIDILCTIDILNQVLQQHTITQRKDLRYYFRHFKDEIFYKMDNKSFEKRVSLLKGKGILDKPKKIVSANNHLDTTKTKEVNMFFINENNIKKLYGVGLDYIHILCERALIPMAMMILSYKKDKRRVFNMFLREKFIQTLMSSLGTIFVEMILYVFNKNHY